MSTVLIETTCLPPIPVVSTIVRHSRLLIEAHEHYQKRSFRNRIYLNGPQGRTLFTIPLEKGKNEQMKIKEVRIAHDVAWPSIFLKLIRSNYGSAPYFEFVIDDLNVLFMKNWKYLWDLNLGLWEIMTKLLHLSIEINTTDTYNQRPSPGVLDLRGQFLPSKSFFSSNMSQEYQQVFSDKHGFVPHLSILDLFMCCGPESSLKLKNSSV